MSNTDHKIVVIAQHGCPPCEQLKEYFNVKGYDFEVIYIGDRFENISDHVFKILWPENKGTPHTLIDGRVCEDPYGFFELGL